MERKERETQERVGEEEREEREERKTGSQGSWDVRGEDSVAGRVGRETNTHSRVVLSGLVSGPCSPCVRAWRLRRTERTTRRQSRSHGEVLLFFFNASDAAAALFLSLSASYSRRDTHARSLSHSLAHLHAHTSSVCPVAATTERCCSRGELSARARTARRSHRPRVERER